MMARHSSVLSLMVPKHIKFQFLFFLFPFFHWDFRPKRSTSDASKCIFVHYFQVNLLIGMQMASEFYTGPIEK